MQPVLYTLDCRFTLSGQRILQVLALGLFRRGVVGAVVLRSVEQAVSDQRGEPAGQLRVGHRVVPAHLGEAGEHVVERQRRGEALVCHAEQMHARRVEIPPLGGREGEHVCGHKAEH